MGIYSIDSRSISSLNERVKRLRFELAKSGNRPTNRVQGERGEGRRRLKLRDFGLISLDSFDFLENQSRVADGSEWGKRVDPF